MVFKRIIPTALATILTLTVANCGNSPSAGKLPTGILLVTVDALRADHLAIYGYHRHTAPFVEELAADAVIFTRAYSPSSWTVPSLASLNLGVFPPSHGVVRGAQKHGQIVGQRSLPQSIKTLAERLKQAGWATFAVAANLHLDSPFGFARGFDRYSCTGFSPAWKVEAELLRMLAEINSTKKPVFIWIHYFDPHHPYHVREPWFSIWAPEATKLERANIMRLQKMWPSVPREVSEHPKRYIKLIQTAYDSEIALMDRSLRHLWKSINRNRDWWFVFSADHGEEFLEHGRISHGFNLYEPTVRIPLVVRAPRPDRRLPKRVDTPVSLVDLAVTIAVIGGASTEGMQGKLLPALIPSETGSADATHSPIPLHLDRHGENLRALVHGPFKVIENTTEHGVEIYNVLSDPLERMNLAAEDPSFTKQELDALHAAFEALPPPPPGKMGHKKLSLEEIKTLKSLGYLR